MEKIPVASQSFTPFHAEPPTWLNFGLLSCSDEQDAIS